MDVMYSSDEDSNDDRENDFDIDDDDDEEDNGSSEDDDPMDDLDEEEDEDDGENSHSYLNYDPTPSTCYPGPKWHTVDELFYRRYGQRRLVRTNGSRVFSKSTHNPYFFQKQACDSLLFIQRLELDHKLIEHNGCVNCIAFNHDGRFLASGSDDQTICVWDWQRNHLKTKIESGHTSNIFHCGWCPTAPNQLVTSSRDGSVRLMDVEKGSTSRLHKQITEVNKFAFNSPQTLVSCGQDSSIYETDLRHPNKAVKLVEVIDSLSNRLTPLYTIDVHPLDNHKIIAGGRSQLIFLYDRRRMPNAIDNTGPSLRLNPRDVEPVNSLLPKAFLPEHHADLSVTCAVYNELGNKILASYSDYDMFVFDSYKFVPEHRFQGHRNHRTIKGCAWYGDDFVLTGSDDGHLYGFDVESEHIVCSLYGDSRGSINCVLRHPTLPVLASSGLDHDVKIWSPTSKQWPQTLKGIKARICNNVMKRNMRLKENKQPRLDIL